MYANILYIYHCDIEDWKCSKGKSTLQLFISFAYYHETYITFLLGFTDKVKMLQLQQYMHCLYMLIWNILD